MKSDTQIQEDVQTQLACEFNLNPSNIGVSVENGVVTLSGIVKNYCQKVAAENAALKIPGVKAVAVEIQIGSSVQPLIERIQK